MTKLFLRATAIALICGGYVTGAAADDDITNQMPRVEHGQLIDPITPPPSAPTYPRIEGQVPDARLRVSPDVSVSGSVSPDSVSGNVQVPLPE